MTNPWPIADSDTAPYWDAIQQRRLLIQRCERCGTHQYYPRAVCTTCTSIEIGWVESPGLGEVYSYTIARRAAHPAFEGRLPYAIVLVDLDEGVRMLANLAADDLNDVHIGARVEVTFAQVDTDVIMPEFRLVGRDERHKFPKI